MLPSVCVRRRFDDPSRKRRTKEVWSQKPHDFGPISKEGVRSTSRVVTKNPAYAKWRQSDDCRCFSHEDEYSSEKARQDPLLSPTSETNTRRFARRAS